MVRVWERCAEWRVLLNDECRGAAEGNDVIAKLLEEDLATAILINLAKLRLGLGIRHVAAQLGHASLKFAEVNAAIIVVIELIKNGPETLIEEQVAQERGKLLLLNPGIAVAVLEGGVLVGTHERGLAHFPALGFNQAVQFSQAAATIAIEIGCVPHVHDLVLGCDDLIHGLQALCSEELELESLLGGGLFGWGSGSSRFGLGLSGLGLGLCGLGFSGSGLVLNRGGRRLGLGLWLVALGRLNGFAGLATHGAGSQCSGCST